MVDLAGVVSPLGIDAAEATLRFHLDHSAVSETIEAGGERWELLESGVVVRRSAASIVHLEDCRATDLAAAGGAVLRFCADGRVLGRDGEERRFERNPRVVIPFDDGWVAVVSVRDAEGRWGDAVQRLGHAPAPELLPELDRVVAWVPHRGALVAATPDGWVFRVDPFSGALERLLMTPLRIDTVVEREGRVFARGRISRAHHVPLEVHEIFVPESPQDAEIFVDYDDPRLVVVDRGPRAPGPVPVPGELSLWQPAVHRTRWGLVATSTWGVGAARLGDVGWADVRIESDEAPEWQVGGTGRELYAITSDGETASVRRWTPEGAVVVARLPRVIRDFRIATDEPFLGPDGRWWTTKAATGDVLAFDGKRWERLGTLPVNGLALHAIGPEHLYAGVERSLWRWRAPAPGVVGGFEPVATGVLASWTSAGLVTWDGTTLRRGEEVLLEDPTLHPAGVHEDGCGRPWLAGAEVVVLEEGGAVRIEHPLLAPPFGGWISGEGTRTGVVLSDWRLVVEVDRPCGTKVDR